MQISEVNIYPIKSLRGISLDLSRVESRGLQYDRRWMLVDKNNWFLTQRQFPKMATIAVEINGNGLTASIGSGGDSPIRIPLEPGNGAKSARVRIWRNRCSAIAYEPEVNEWFGDVLGASVRLVYMPDITKRLAHAPYKVKADDHVSFADGFPFLLIGGGSLADINSRLDQPVPMKRFRPNFVVLGTVPFEEDTWKRIRIGDNVFHVVKSCGRCIITTTDQETGVRNGGEPLKTLASYRTNRIGKKNKVLFGQNLIADKPGGVVKVGDEVEVLDWK